MPIQAVRTLASSQNGVAAFILQCKRIDFHYCDWAGSSRGMKYVIARLKPQLFLSPNICLVDSSFLRHSLPKFAAENPQIEIRISPRPHKHPVVRGYYINGREKVICVRNLEKDQILKKANILKNASGEKLKLVRQAVASMNQSIRGIWDPYHGDIKKV
ncbi:39S ribosomal protein L51, mitochondrial [Ophidiomyces ophidiicola]|nr:39S ribosomal protein L51, mitochondrial [Ophidiomyces ophidiicola]KAI1981907.1 39S ribosomal protein L51, mitochondrial [Ophidiomyces ophidiicola]KAI1987638.1 39S ribosomal protein L51, mitochondrial [Ophidiomyces ophidiicola]KAI1991862.1 39S ribosomal protein L51, mitochondrial [Ophidiomyces ophidiicola]KAI1996492.1 39S ribosomal protein L51, mitochondrial [Ophidiomyces ophidiicola]